MIATINPVFILFLVSIGSLIEFPKQKYKGSRILSSTISNKIPTQTIWLATFNWPESGKDPSIDTLKWFTFGLKFLINETAHKLRKKWLLCKYMTFWLIKKNTTIVSQKVVMLWICNRPKDEIKVLYSQLEISHVISEMPLASRSDLKKLNYFNFSSFLKFFVWNISYYKAEYIIEKESKKID